MSKARDRRRKRQRDSFAAHATREARALHDWDDSAEKVRRGGELYGLRSAAKPRPMTVGHSAGRSKVNIIQSGGNRHPAKYGPFTRWVTGRR